LLKAGAATGLAATLAWLRFFARAAEPMIKVGEARKNDQGLLIHDLQSPFQEGTTQFGVLLPDKREANKRYPVVYVLPVEAGQGGQFGNGMSEVKKHNLHNKHQAIFVAPTFSAIPWYADHPENPRIRQESYFLEVVLPAVEKHYPVQTEISGRLLLGFSKSGWGAFSLLLRNPKLFGKAAAWDAPMLMEAPNKYEMDRIFATQKNFEQYQITKLLEGRAAELGKQKRLILLGYGNFRSHHQSLHALMTKLKIEHEYRDGPERTHDWHSGWVPEAVGLLFS
jgi:S-formylglutathione hydrolase FrmB